MSYQTQWIIPQRVIHVFLQGQISGVEMQAVLDNVSYLTTQTSYSEVHVIFDFVHIYSHSPLVEIAKVIRHMRPIENLGWLLTAGDTSPVVSMAFSTAIQLMDKRMRQLTTLDEALGFLQDMLLGVDWDDVSIDNLYNART